MPYREAALAQLDRLEQKFEESCNETGLETRRQNAQCKAERTGIDRDFYHIVLCVMFGATAAALSPFAQAGLITWMGL